MSMTDYDRALVKLRAFKMLEGWGTLLPGAPEEGKLRTWTFTETMARADELAAWALSPCSGSVDGGEAQS